MVKRKSLAIGVGESFHLPSDVWLVIQDQQKETHPDIPVDDYKIELTFPGGVYQIERPDPQCPSGKRKVTVTLEVYVTLTVKSKLTKDPAAACSYKMDYSIIADTARSRIKSHKDGECVPKK